MYARGNTWLFNMGFPIDCLCNSGETIFIGTVNVDLTPVTNRLNTLISQGINNGNSLADILAELVTLNSPLTQNILTTTVAGSIPAGVQSYSIFNMGINPNDPNTTFNSMIIGGITISSRSIAFGNSSDSQARLSNPVTYNPNGNTLLIVYNN